MYNIYITAFQNRHDEMGKVFAFRKVRRIIVNKKDVTLYYQKTMETVYYDRIDTVQVIDETLDDIEYEQERG
jgi:hypothetical protein